jgi:hypothetical protein
LKIEKETTTIKSVISVSRKRRMYWKKKTSEASDLWWIGCEKLLANRTWKKPEILSARVFRFQWQGTEGTGAEVSRFHWHVARRYRSRSIQVLVTGSQKEQEQKYPGSIDMWPEDIGAEVSRFWWQGRGQKEQEQKYPGSIDMWPEDTGAEVSRFWWQEARRKRSRSIQVLMTGGQKEQE